MIREPKNDTPIFNFTNILLIIMMAVVLLLIGIVYTTTNKTTKTTNEEDTTIVEQRRFTLVANPTEEVSENNIEEVKEETPAKNEVNTDEFAYTEKKTKNPLVIIPIFIVIAFAIEFIVIVVQRNKIIKATDELNKLKSEQKPLDIEKDILNTEKKEEEDKEC